MRRLVKGALIALVIAGLVLAISGLVWWVPATPERGGHDCLGTLIGCLNA